MFTKILIANRGEIASRVIKTARRMGIATVAVHSDVDANARHVRMADEAVRIGPAPARESYLVGANIIAAAQATGAQAIHPGYGFLSENDEFAEQCAAEGIVFIGPPAAAIRAMGSKSAAKTLMAKAGVPLTPGYHGDDQDPALLAREAGKIGFPVLIKASAGGGGKGMRRVDKGEDFAAALASRWHEAKSAFGDDRVLVEQYVLKPRHIEIQVFADSRGHCVYLFERDCSVQRRHQKVLEEAPAPGFDSRKMSQAAVDAAKAIHYVGAGTVEFIAEQDGRFYFMEMNTRLQVEHPVTEMITGLDLVEWQFRVASGEKIPLSQKEIATKGHAIEARIYAEDPRRDFLPATGRLLHLAFPAQTADVRVDTGVEQGGEITPWYDPMIAKLVVHGRDRADALERLRSALAGVEIVGVTTNVEFLRKVAASRAFSSAELDTGLIERNRAELISAIDLAPFLAAAAFAELAHEETEARRLAAATGDPFSPWHHVDGWQLNADAHHDFVFVEGGVEHSVRIRFGDEDPRKASKTRAIREGNDWHVLCDGVYRRLSLKPQLALSLIHISEPTRLLSISYA